MADQHNQDLTQHNNQPASAERYWATGTYVAVLFGTLGLLFNIVALFWFRQRSNFVANHAKQAVGLQVAAVAISTLLNMAFGAGLVGFGFGRNMMGGGITMALAGGIGLVFFGAVLMMVLLGALSALRGQRFRYPLFGEFVDKLGEPGQRQRT